ncbi:MAG: GNAT family N-acetyltransferase [Anaerolineae bacterium]|nr:GNAT family N-acetyltransferase [Anaerolineae bacterium]
MTIREANLSDARSIAEIQITAWKSAYRGLLPDDMLDRLSVNASEKRWAERIAEPQGHLVVAEIPCGEERRVVGFAGCGNCQDEDVDREKVGELHVIYVHPEAWRKGYGAALLEEALRELREDGFEDAILWVLEGNAQAIKFYTAAGFEADGGSKVKKRRDSTEMPVIRYRRKIVYGIEEREA